MQCSVTPCEKAAVARGLCINHYQKWRKYGDANVVKQVQFHGISIKERFFKYVKKTDACWLWVGGLNNGYGQIRVDGAPMLAHRLSWQIHNGGIPEGKYTLHKCDNPICVNPDHLYIGDQFDNMDDMWTRGRANPGLVQGEKHGMVKLTDDLVREIRESTMTTKELMAKMQVCETTVRDIKNRKVWKHLP